MNGEIKGGQTYGQVLSEEIGTTFILAMYIFPDNSEGKNKNKLTKNTQQPHHD